MTITVNALIKKTPSPTVPAERYERAPKGERYLAETEDNLRPI